MARALRPGIFRTSDAAFTLSASEVDDTPEDQNIKAKAFENTIYSIFEYANNPLPETIG